MPVSAIHQIALLPADPRQNSAFFSAFNSWEVQNEVYAGATVAVGQTSSQPLTAGCCCPDCCKVCAPFLGGGVVAGDHYRAEFTVIVSGLEGSEVVYGVPLNGTYVLRNDPGRFNTGNSAVYSNVEEIDGYTRWVDLHLHCSDDCEDETTFASAYVRLLSGELVLISDNCNFFVGASEWTNVGGTFGFSAVQSHAEPLPVDCCDNPGIPLECACGGFKAPNGWLIIPNSCLLDYLNSSNDVVTTSCGNCPVVTLRPTTISPTGVIYTTVEGIPEACGFLVGTVDRGAAHGIQVFCGGDQVEYTTTTGGLFDFPNETRSCSDGWPTITYAPEGGAMGYLSTPPFDVLEDGGGNARFNCVAGGCVSPSRWEHPAFPSGVPLYAYYAALYAGSITYVPF